MQNTVCGSKRKADEGPNERNFSNRLKNNIARNSSCTNIGSINGMKDNKVLFLGKHKRREKIKNKSKKKYTTVVVTPKEEVKQP